MINTLTAYMKVSFLLSCSDTIQNNKNMVISSLYVKYQLLFVSRLRDTVLSSHKLKDNTLFYLTLCLFPTMTSLCYTHIHRHTHTCWIYSQNAPELSSIFRAAEHLYSFVATMKCNIIYMKLWSIMIQSEASIRFKES